MCLTKSGGSWYIARPSPGVCVSPSRAGFPNHRSSRRPPVAVYRTDLIGNRLNSNPNSKSHVQPVSTGIPTGLTGLPAGMTGLWIFIFLNWDRFDTDPNRNRVGPVTTGFVNPGQKSGLDAWARFATQREKVTVWGNWGRALPPRRVIGRIGEWRRWHGTPAGPGCPCRSSWGRLARSAGPPLWLTIPV